MASTSQGYSKITSLNAVKALGGGSLTPIPASARWVMIQAETQNIRWRDDGTNPTATDGMLLKAGETMIYDGCLADLKMIEVTASATVHVTFYKS